MKNPWSWEDRMIFANFVLADGGTVGEATGPQEAGLLNFGYIGAGCDHTFTQDFGYSVPASSFHNEENGNQTYWVRKGQRYREYRA